LPEISSFVVYSDDKPKPGKCQGMFNGPLALFGWFVHEALSTALEVIGLSVNHAGGNSETAACWFSLMRSVASAPPAIRITWNALLPAERNSGSTLLAPSPRLAICSAFESVSEEIRRGYRRTPDAAISKDNGMTGQTSRRLN
jgi:hypothetical protein